MTMQAKALLIVFILIANPLLVLLYRKVKDQPLIDALREAFDFEIRLT